MGNVARQGWSRVDRGTKCVIARPLIETVCSCCHTFLSESIVYGLHIRGRLGEDQGARIDRDSEVLSKIGNITRHWLSVPDRVRDYQLDNMDADIGIRGDSECNLIDEATSDRLDRKEAVAGAECDGVPSAVLSVQFIDSVLLLFN